MIGEKKQTTSNLPSSVHSVQGLVTEYTPLTMDVNSGLPIGVNR